MNFNTNEISTQMNFQLENDAMMASKRRCKINLLSLSFVSKIISKSLVI